MGYADRVDFLDGKRKKTLYTRSECEAIIQKKDEEFQRREKKLISKFNRYKSSVYKKYVLVGGMAIAGTVVIAHIVWPKYRIPSDAVMYDYIRIIHSGDTIQGIVEESYVMGRNEESFKSKKAYENYLLDINTNIIDDNKIYSGDYITVPVVVDKEIYNQLVKEEISSEDLVQSQGKMR